MVPRGRIELPTQGFSGLCSTTELPWLIFFFLIFNCRHTPTIRGLLYTGKTEVQQWRGWLIILFFKIVKCRHTPDFSGLARTLSRSIGNWAYWNYNPAMAELTYLIFCYTKNKKRNAIYNYVRFNFKSKC